jgi:hypothetical protein
VASAYATRNRSRFEAGRFTPRRRSSWNSSVQHRSRSSARSLAWCLAFHPQPGRVIAAEGEIRTRGRSRARALPRLKINCMPRINPHTIKIGCDITFSDGAEINQHKNRNISDEERKSARQREGKCALTFEFSTLLLIKRENALRARILAKCQVISRAVSSPR